MNKRCLRFAACLLATLLCLSTAGFSRAEGEKKHTTVMVYMCGSNLESKYRKGTQSMGDMIASKFNRDKVNVVVLAGGANYWGGGYDPNALTLLELTGRRPSEVEKYPVASMGDPQTLTKFLNTCCERYPAEHYDLVLWDHGGGPNSGVCFDYRYDYDSLSTSDITTALQESPFAQNPLDLLIFHACLMSSAEVANAVAPYAKCMVAGEDSIYGMGYEWLSGLENDRDAFITARRIVDDAYACNGGIITTINASEHNAFAAIDLGRMRQIVAGMDAFFPEVSGSLNPSSFTAMSGQRRTTTAFGIGESGPDSDFDLVDLGDLITNYRSMGEAQADALLSAIEGSVYCRADPTTHCTGLTVYHPFANKKALEQRLASYAGLGFSQAYTAYVQAFSELLLDEPMTSWTKLLTGTPIVNKASFSVFTLKLNADQAAHFSNAHLYVLYQRDDGSWQMVFMNPDVRYEDGELTGEFNGTALYAVDGNGDPISGPLEYTADGQGGYWIAADLDLKGEDGQISTQRVLISCALEADTKRLIPGAVSVWEDFLSGYTSAYDAVFSDYESIRIPVNARIAPEDDGGEIPRFADWARAEADEAWSSAIDDSWHFELLNDTLPKERLYAAFEVTDSQNNRYSSSLHAVRGESSLDIQMDYNNDEIETLTLSDQSMALENDSLRFSATALYEGEREAILNVEDLSINDVPVSDGVVTAVYGSGPNWGLTPGESQPVSFSVDVSRFSEDLDRQKIAYALTAQDVLTGESLGTVRGEVYIQTALLFGEDS